jgi:hypothetical protein
LERIQNKYEVVRVDTSDIYFKHPVKGACASKSESETMRFRDCSSSSFVRAAAGKVLFNENSMHAHGVKAAHPTTATFRFKYSRALTHLQSVCAPLMLWRVVCIFAAERMAKITL